MLTHFDHVTIAVHALAPASERYSHLLGTSPIWQTRAPELGIESSVFALSNGCIELVAPLGDALGAQALAERIDAGGEGVISLALGTEDAEATFSELKRAGVRASPVTAGETRSLAGIERTFRSIELSPRATRGISLLVLERPDLTALRPTAGADAAAVEAIDHIVIRTQDPDAAIAFYRDALGIRLALDRAVGATRMLFFRLGGVTLEVVHAPNAGATDTLYGVAYRVRDPDAAHARLGSAGFSLSEIRSGAKPGTRTFTVRDGTSGVPTLVLRDPARDAT